MTSCLTSSQQAYNSNVIAKQLLARQKANEARALQQEYKASQIPQQPAKCATRVKATITLNQDLEETTKALYFALKQANDEKIACYNFSEKVRKDRMAHAPSTQAK